jgi:IS30 family transposase
MQKKYQRLTYAERKSIEQALGKRMSLSGIARMLGRSTSTISREVMRGCIFEKSGGYGTVFNDCMNREFCDNEHICLNPDCKRSYCCGCRFCFHVCHEYEKELCPGLKTPPYACNGCPDRRRCSLEKAIYRAKTSDKEALRLLTEKREGIDIDRDEIQRIGAIISPLIAKGQSPWHIIANHKDELMISDKTLYKYIAMGLFDAKTTDLRRAVKMRPRKHKRQVKIDRKCRLDRTYADFMEFIEKHPDMEVPQMDTVIGAKGRGEKCLLTIHFPKSEVLLAFLRDANTAKSVTDIFERMKLDLGYNRFLELFPAILTDNGPEFTDPDAIETDDEIGLLWTRLFYCEPYAAWQKPHIENSHRLLRYILPKGNSLNNFTQDDITLALCHINSYRRKSLGGQSPIDVFAKAFGNKMLKLLGIFLVPADEINLTPDLLKK